MIKLSIDVDISEPMKRLAGMKARSRDFRDTFERARVELEKANAKNFASGGLMVGKWKRREGTEAWPVLVKTGTLMRSLTSLTGPPNRIGRTKAQFGTDVEYAKFHQRGAEDLPSRKIVFEPRGWAHKVADDAADHIVGMGRYFT